MDRVEILVQLLGDDRAMSSLRDVRRLVSDLNGNKVQLKMDASQIDRSIADATRRLKELTARRHDVKLDIDNRAASVTAEISKINQQIKELTTQRKSIKIQLDGARELENQMLSWMQLAHDLERQLHSMNPSDSGFKQLQADIRTARDEYNRLADMKKRITFDHTDLREIDRQIVELTRKRDALVAKRDSIKMDTSALKEVDRQIEEVKRELDDLTNQRKNIAIDADINNEALRQANAELQDMERNSISVSDALKGIGQAFSTVGSLFNEWQSFVGGDILETITRTMTGYATIMASKGLEGASSRFDTFRTFPKIMEVMGYSFDETTAAVQRMEASVLGLPTALNDIIDMAKDFILLTGDLTRGTDLATSINSLFVAGGADSEQVRIGLKQFRDLLSKGSLTDREWDSLARTLGAALRFIASEAGYAENEFGAFRTALKAGEISVEDFMDAVIRAGQSGKLKDVLEEMKDTINSTTTNLRTSFAKLGETVLSEIDNLFLTHTGEGLPGTILAISTAVKENLIPAVQEWLQLNGDRLFGLFEKIRDFDWGGLIRAIADKALAVAETIFKVVEMIGSDRIVWFVSTGLTWAGLLGDFFTLLGRAFNAAGSLASMFVTFQIVNKGLGSLFSSVGNWKTMLKGVGGAAGAVAVVGLVGLVIAEYAKIAEYIGSLEIGNLDENLPKVMKLAGMGAAIASVLTALGSVATAIKGGSAVVGGGMALAALFSGVVYLYTEVLGQMAELAQAISSADLDNFDENWAKLQKFAQSVENMVTGMTVVNTALVGLGAGIGAILGGAGGAVAGGAIVGVGVLAGDLLAGLHIEELREMSGVLKEMAEAMNSISDADVPTDEEIDRFKTVIDKFSRILEGLPSFVFKGGDIDNLKEFIHSMNVLNEVDVDEVDMDNIEAVVDRVADIILSLTEKLTETFGYGSPAAEHANQLALAVENMVNVVENLGEAAVVMREIKPTLTTLGIEVDEAGNIDVESAFGRLQTKLKAVLQALMDLDKIAEGNTFGVGLLDRWRTSNQDNIVANLRTMLEELSGVARIINDKAEEFDKLDEYKINMVAFQAGNIVNALHELGAVMQNGDVFGVLELLASMIQEGIAKNLTDIGEYLNELASFFNNVNAEELNQSVNNANEYKGKFETIIKTMQDLSDLFGEGTIATLWESLGMNAKEGNMTKLKSIAESMKTLVTDISEAMKASEDIDLDALGTFKEGLSAVIQTMEEIVGGMTTPAQSSGGRGPDAATIFSQKIEGLKKYAEGIGYLLGVIKAINEYLPQIQAIRDADIDKKIGEIVDNTISAAQNIPEDIDDLTERMTQLKTLAEELKNIVDTIAGMQENLTAMSENETLMLLGEQLTLLISTLGGMELDEEAGGNITALAETLTAVGESIMVLVEDYLAVLIETITTLSDDLIVLTEEVLTNLQAKLEDVTQAVDDLREAMENAKKATEEWRSALLKLISALDSATPAVSGLTSEVNMFASAVSGAVAQVGSLAGALAGLGGMSISLPSVSVGGLGSVGASTGGMGGRGNIAVPYSTGGPVYLATGGAFWAPKGTDTVPAMLTPGEFVLKRKAVQKLGVPFLNLLNRLDIPSAIDALMSRVVLPSGMSYVTYDNRRTYDNHATVNQNIYTNNPNYTFRRASRWAHAL